MGQIDLVVFGFPCQDLSVAGGRKGFQGERSSLFYDAIRVIEYAKRHCGTRFALLENVPGAFSSNKGADFAAVVEQMAGLSDVDVPTNGWGKEGAALGSNGLLEWSVLDAQWFGLAQRRKRVFAIVDFGEWASRPPILLEREGLRGDSAPSREARESVTADVRGCLASGTDLAGPILASCGEKQWLGNQEAFSGEYHVVESLVCCHGTQDPITNTETAYAMGCNSDQENVIAIAGNIIGRTEGNGGNGNGFDASGACYTLTTNDRHAVAYPINTMTCQGRPSDNGRMGLGLGDDGDPCPTITSAHSHAVVYCGTQNDALRDLGIEICPTLRAGHGGGAVNPMMVSSVVRRLTPVECERLQGFPDNFTKIPYRNKSADDCPNGVRYKALGNSMAVNVMAWIGKRIEQAVTICY